MHFIESDKKEKSPKKGDKKGKKEEGKNRSVVWHLTLVLASACCL